MRKTEGLWYRLTAWENSPILIWLSNTITEWGEFIADRFIKDLGDERTYNKTIRILVNIGKPAIPGLIEALEYGSGEFKANAAFALAGISEKFPVADLDKAKPVLIEVLGDEDWRARGMAARALGKIGGVSEVPVLMEALKDDHVWPRSRAAEALEKIGPRSYDDLKALIPIARKLKMEGEDPEPIMKLHSKWVGVLGKTAGGIIADKEFHVPRMERPDKTERILRVRRFCA
jgi:hypothetical protein